MSSRGRFARIPAGTLPRLGLLKSKRNTFFFSARIIPWITLFSVTAALAQPPGLGSPPTGGNPTTDPAPPQPEFPAEGFPPQSRVKRPKIDIDLEEAKIPKKPSAPPSLYQTPPPEFFHCQRTFVHRGKTLGCDSNIRLDGEKLRPIIQDTPEAVAELNDYQRTRVSLRNLAYVGTAGLFLILGGIVLAGQASSETAQSIRRITLISGAGIVGGSFLFGVSASQANEKRLGNAVRLYNEKHPETPIELQFSTGIQF